MSGIRNFDKEISRFLALKKRLLDWDGPEFLRKEAKRDADCKNVCVELFELARTLRESELSAKDGAISPTSETFRTEWNDYQRRWEKDVRSVWTFVTAPEMAELFDGVEFESVFANGTKEEISKHAKIQFAARIESLRDISKLLADDHEDESDTLDDFIKSAIQLWKSTGFSVDSAFEKIEIAPIVLVPHSVTNRTTLNKPLSLFEYWNEARKAYVLGLPLASIALSRVTLEIFLREVHHANRTGADKLGGYIEFIKKHAKMDVPTMEKIRKIANSILHGLGDEFLGQQIAGKPEATARQILFDLKDLIESS